MRITSKTGSGMVCGKLHNIVITEFDDKYFIIISNNGKIGTLVETLFETNAMKTSSSLTCKVLFGIDKPEVHAVAQSLIETLKIRKSVIFGFSVTDYDSTTATNMRQLISETLKNNEKEKLPRENGIS